MNNFKNNMKIAITGGSGFIGTRLIQMLQQDGHDTNIIDIADQNPINVLDQEKLNQAVKGVDAIYHLAAEHRDDVSPRDKYYEVNGQGTANVVKAAEQNNIKKIVFTSTVAVYALGRGDKSENSKVEPYNDYGKSKLEAEEHLKTWAKADPERSCIIVRPAVVFGENNRGNVYTLMKQIERQRFLMIGRGKNKKSMGYVGNVANFLKYCMTLDCNFKIFNYADKPDLSARELVDVIYDGLEKTRSNFFIPYGVGLVAGYGFDVLSHVTGKKLPISSIRVKKFCADTIVTADRAMDTGYAPQYSLSEGIHRMINHDFKGGRK
ncbi:MAG: NAD-dependent epimerase/dehydratase family protein [Alphaproteobacteria bacterium]